MSARNILIIDDDEARRKELSQEILSGYTVTAVNTPEQVPAGSFDVILLAEGSVHEPESLSHAHPATPIIWLGSNAPASTAAGRPGGPGIFAVLPPDSSAGDTLETVRAAVAQRERLEIWAASRAADDLFPTRPDGVILTDLDERIQFLNEAARTFLGLPTSGWEGRTLESLVDIPQLKQSILDVQNNQANPFILHPSGRDPHILQVTRLAGIGTVTTLQNIAHYKEVETLRTELIQMISHDLRSPLTAILGYIELVAKVGPISPEQEDFIRRARLSVSVITEFIDSLLDLSQLDAESEKLRELVSLHQILDECQIALQPLFDEKEQSIQMQVPEDLPKVCGRPNRLRQMFNNLLENAHKYTKKGGRITVKARLEGSQVLLEVEDDGIGIPPSEIPFIFDKMYRGQNIPLEAPGSGLGLAIVKSIVENHGGRLWCESEVGQGTVFTILLPAAPPSS